jgi:epoxide hydrolase-like predicted phosphatase
MIKAVLFDFGGVLTAGGKKGYIGQILAELYDADPKTIEYGDLHYLFRRGKGGEDDALFETLNKRYNANVTKDMFLKRAHQDLVAAPEVYELAKTLREYGIRTGLLSNIFSMQAEVFRKEGWYDGFDPIVLSCESGYAKPDKELYQLAIDKLALKPDEIIFIDDQEKCTIPADEMGIHTVLAVSPKQTVDDTKALILKLNGIDLS